MNCYEEKNSQLKKEDPVVKFFLETSEEDQRKVLDKIARKINKEQREIVEKYGSK